MRSGSAPGTTGGAAAAEALSTRALVMRAELLGTSTLTPPSSASALAASQSARQTSELPAQPPPRSAVRRRIAPPALSPARGLLAFEAGSAAVSPRRRRVRSSLGSASGLPSSPLALPASPRAPRHPGATDRAGAASPAAGAGRRAREAAWSGTGSPPPRRGRHSPLHSAPGAPAGAATAAGASAGAASAAVADVDAVSSHALGALSPASRDLLAAPRAGWRRVSKVPYKVLDAPALLDDFYLSLLDWSALDVLAVGLGPDLFLWNAATAGVTRLLGFEGEDETVTAVSWTESGRRVAVASSEGRVQLWDAETERQVRSFPDHPQRVSTMSWANNLLATGGRDNTIRVFDARKGGRPVMRLSGHESEVCGLRWSPDRATLASGGNDNRVLLWSVAGAVRAKRQASSSSSSGAASGDGAASGLSARLEPLYRLSGHRAAVKALDWSPHRRGLLVSGGGTLDKSLRFWNALTGECVGCVDTGCQVCNVRWSLSGEELVTTHGYSRNDVCLWRYPSMQRLATLSGHKSRVLFMAMDPSGQSVVTGAGDETLRFWRVFPPMSGAQRAARPERRLSAGSRPASPSAASASSPGPASSPALLAALAGETLR